MEKWNRFWYTKKPSHLLSLLRLSFGLWMVLKFMGWHSPMQRIHEWGWRWPRSARPSRFPLEGFSPDVPIVGWLIPDVSLEMYTLIMNALPVAGLLVCLGVFHRVTGPLLWLLFTYYVGSSQLVYSHHNNMLWVMLTILAFSPASDHFSVDAVLRRLWNKDYRPPLRSMLPLRLVQVFLVLLYCSTTFGKLNQGWYQGHVMAIMERPYHLRGYFAVEIYRVFGAQVISWFTLYSEGMLAVGLIHPRTRLLAIFGGVMLHGTIDLMMPVTTFSVQMMSSYIAFLDPTPRRNVVHYAPDSPVRFAVWPMRALNWIVRLRFEERPGPWGIDLHGGRSYTGYWAAIETALRLPLLFPIAFIAGAPFTLLQPNPPDEADEADETTSDRVPAPV